jgi:hypothetical protein
MKPNFTYLVAAFLLLCFTATAHAEIYKWTDANGKTHYSQTPPEDNKTKAEDIGDEIDMAAGTGSGSTTTNEAAPAETAADDEMTAARKQGEENSVKHNAFCEQQKAALKQLLSNPVIRWKSKEEEEKVLSAKEREGKIAEFEKNIQELCNQDVLPGKQSIDIK